MATLPEKIKEHKEEYFYKLYITKNIRLMSENIAKLSGGKYINIDFDDILHPKKEEETRSSDEIIEGIREKLKKL